MQSHPSIGSTSAWKIFPLGLALGLLAFVPAMVYLLSDSGAVTLADLATYALGAVSVVVAAFLLLMAFLWVCECMTEESERPDKR